MGNYGNTIDYWYRRAAVVLWKKEDNDVMEFILSDDLALEKLHALTKRKNQETKIINIINKAKSYLQQYSRHKEKSKSINLLTDIAIYINNPSVAKELLSQFSCNDLNEKNVASLFKLESKYGASWTLDLISSWDNDYHSYNNFDLQTNIYQFIKQWVQLKGEQSLIRYFLQYHIDQTIKQNKYDATSVKSCDDNLHKRTKITINLLQAATLISDNQQFEFLLSSLIENPLLYPLDTLIKILLEIKPYILERHIKQYKSFKEDVINILKKYIDNGPRESDDYSIESNITCTCKYCDTAKEFLNSKDEQEMIWPIAGDHRDHIGSVFYNYNIPVDLSVRKQGSPYKLIMVKKKDYFTQERKEYDRLYKLHLKINEKTS